MHTEETIDTYMKCREQGLNTIQAADKVGVSVSAGWQWDKGRFPHAYAGEYRSEERYAEHQEIMEKLRVEQEEARKKEVFNLEAALTKRLLETMDELDRLKRKLREYKEKDNS